MQKDIGAVMGLYPTPVTIVGTVAEGRVNWLPVAHVGVVEHTRFLISVDKAHEFSVRGIETNGTVSVSLVNRDILAAADYCGLHKGAQEDKSQVFPHHFDEVEGAPIPDNAPLVMTCRVERCIIYLDSMKRDFPGERSVFYEESKNVHQGFQNPGM